MNLKFGDIISVYFDSDSCWGTEGFHTAIVLFEDTEDAEKLMIYWLDEELINCRKISSGAPATDDAKNLLECFDKDDITIIGNLATKR